MLRMRVTLLHWLALRTTKTGHTLSDVQHPLLLESIEFPPPVISVAIEPERASDTDSLEETL